MSLQSVSDPAKLRRIIAAMLLIDGDIALDDVLRRVVDEARSITGARYGALGVVNDDRTSLARFITSGMSAEMEAEIGDRPKGLGVLGLLIAEPFPLRINDLSSHPDTVGFPPGHPPMSSFLGVPIIIRGETYGNLYLTDKIGWSEFTEDDLELVEALAVAAGTVIQNVRLHALQQTTAVHEDRERLARDLHDRVIQRIFGAGLMLQGMSKGVAPDELPERISAITEELDEGIRELRSTIFALGLGGNDRGIRSRLAELVRDLSGIVGFEITLRFDGPVDSAISPNVSEHIVAVVRESVTNIEKHAHATAATILLSAHGTLCRLQVADNGHGLPADWPSNGGRGMVNIEGRAQSLDGTLGIVSAPDGGTILNWHVPIQ
jgi:signal transduction histidine kinase